MTEAVDRRLTWRRSQACADTRCVEVAGEGEHIYLRGGDAPGDGLLRFTRAEWEAFLAGAKAGDFDTL